MLVLSGVESEKLLAWKRPDFHTCVGLCRRWNEELCVSVEGEVYYRFFVAVLPERFSRRGSLLHVRVGEVKRFNLNAIVYVETECDVSGVCRDAHSCWVTELHKEVVPDRRIDVPASEVSYPEETDVLVLGSDDDELFVEVVVSYLASESFQRPTEETMIDLTVRYLPMMVIRVFLFRRSYGGGCSCGSRWRSDLRFLLSSGMSASQRVLRF